MVGRPGAFDGAVLDVNPGRLASVECFGEAFTGFDNFLFCNVSRGSEERLRVFGEAFEIWSVGSIGVAFHVMFFGWRMAFTQAPEIRGKLFSTGD